MKRTLRRIPYASSPINVIGLLFGSFNPAHQGHVDISLRAKKILQLDDIFWIITPQNPFKAKHNLQPLAQRESVASHFAIRHNFRLGALEKKFHTYYTHDSIRRLICLHRQSRFVFIVGADILPRFLQWRAAHRLLRYVSFYVVSRPSYSNAINTSSFSFYYQSAKRRRENFVPFYTKNFPLWMADTHPRNPLSSSSVRQKHNRDIAKKNII